MRADPGVDAVCMKRVVGRLLARQPSYFIALHHVLHADATRANRSVQRELWQTGGRTGGRRRSGFHKTHRCDEGEQLYTVSVVPTRDHPVKGR